MRTPPLAILECLYRHRARPIDEIAPLNDSYEFATRWAIFHESGDFAPLILVIEGDSHKPEIIEEEITRYLGLCETYGRCPTRGGRIGCDALVVDVCLSRRQAQITGRRIERFGPVLNEQTGETEVHPIWHCIANEFLRSGFRPESEPDPNVKRGRPRKSDREASAKGGKS